MESHRRGKKGKTELRIRGLTGHEAADQVLSQLCTALLSPLSCSSRTEAAAADGCARNPSKNMH